MKNIITLFLVSIFTSNLFAQKILSQKWHVFYSGGNKNYFTKTYTISKDGVVENQFGSGGQFDNSPMTIPVVDIIANDTEERVITKYDDSIYYAIVFKNITAKNALVCYGAQECKTIEEAKNFVPTEEQYSNWYTLQGYEAENKKPVMKNFTKADAKELVTYIVDYVNKTTDKLNISKDDPRALGIALLIATLPSTFAESKGFHAYKSLSVIEKGMNKYKNDPEIKKIMSQLKLGNGK